MELNALPDALLQQIAGGATQTGDAVAISVLRKALDLQAAQAGQLIAAVAASVPDPDNRIGRHIDVRA